MSGKKVVLLAGRGVSTHVVFHALHKRFDIAAVILEEKESASLFIKRRAKKLGWLTAIGQVMFQLFIVKILQAISKARRRQIIATYGLNTGQIDNKYVKYVSSVNAAECITLLQSISPDVVVVNGTRIISKKVLQSVNCKFINMHAGITPAYRGVHGGYWALVNNDYDNCGVTIHLVDSGVDTGNVLYQEKITTTPQDNFTTYPLLQLAAGLPRMLDAVQQALANELQPISLPETYSRQWYHPTLWQYLWYAVTKGVR